MEKKENHAKICALNVQEKLKLQKIFWSLILVGWISLLIMAVVSAAPSSSGSISGSATSNSPPLSPASIRTSNSLTSGSSNSGISTSPPPLSPASVRTSNSLTSGSSNSGTSTSPPQSPVSFRTPHAPSGSNQQPHLPTPSETLRINTHMSYDHQHFDGILSPGAASHTSSNGHSTISGSTGSELTDEEINASVNTLIILNVPKYPDSPDSPTYNFKLNFVEDPMHHEDGLISVKLYDFNINTIFRYKYDILRLANLKYYLIRKNGKPSNGEIASASNTIRDGDFIAFLRPDVKENEHVGSSNQPH